MSATNQHVGLMEAELVRAFTTPNADQRNSGGRQPSPLSSMPRTQQKQVRGVSRPLCNNDDEEDVTDRKMHQRTKQIQYGLNTDGYANMVRLVKSDSRLRNGGVLPLQPPSATLKVSKRAWDVLARKWRRALHLFDDVFIEEEDKDTTTLEQVVEQQRMKWVAQRNQNLSRADRTPMSASSIFAARNSPSVVKRLPMEDNMKPILRSLEYFQDLHAVVPDHASSLTRGNTGVSPTDAGIKMFIAPSAEASLFHVLSTEESPKSRGHAAGSSRGRSPSPDMPVTPSTIVQMRGGGAPAASSSPLERSQRSPSPPTQQSPLSAPMMTTSATSSSLSPFAAPFCPPSVHSVAADVMRSTRNYSPTLPSSGAAGPSSGAASFPQHQQASQHQTFTSYYPSPVLRLENSFGVAASLNPLPTSSTFPNGPTVSVGARPSSQPMFAPPPPYQTNSKQKSDK